MSCFSGPEVSNDGLIFYLDALNSKSLANGTNVWIDIVGNLQSNTSNLTYSSIGAFNYDATANKKTVYALNSSRFVNTNYTWNAWVLGVMTVNDNMPVIGYGSGSWPRLGFRHIGNWAFCAYNTSGPPLTVDVSIGPTSTTNWINICAVCDYTNGVIKTYRNGKYYAQGTFIDTTGNGSTLGIGLASGTFAGWNAAFSGSISSFSIFNRVLSATEIQQNFNALRGRFGI